MRDIDDTLRKYADLTIRVGLNLQPGQRLAIIGPLANGGVSLDAAPLVRSVTETAYRAGASYVEAIWGDEALQLARFDHAPRDSFGATSRWLGPALLEHARAGDAVLLISARRAFVVGATGRSGSRRSSGGCPVLTSGGRVEVYEATEM